MDAEFRNWLNKIRSEDLALAGRCESMEKDILSMPGVESLTLSRTELSSRIVKSEDK